MLEAPTRSKLGGCCARAASVHAAAAPPRREMNSRRLNRSNAIRWPTGQRQIAAYPMDGSQSAPMSAVGLGCVITLRQRLLRLTTRQACGDATVLSVLF